MAYREWHLAAPLPLSPMRVKVLMQHGCSNQAMYMATYFLIQLDYFLLDPVWQGWCSLNEILVVTMHAELIVY